MKRFNLEKLKIRAVSAIVLAAVTLSIVVYGGWPFMMFVFLIASWALYEWLDLARKTEKTLLLVIIGAIYVLVAFFYCYFIRSVFPLPVTFLFLALVWMSDTGAYFVGKMVGGARMASEISPSKTWAGFVGATAFPAVIFALWLVAADMHHESVNFVALDFIRALAFGAILGMVGQSGDLIVSAIKRQAHVKDAGKLIPGHGGILDRVDSMMLMAPVFVLFVNGFFAHG